MSGQTVSEKIVVDELVRVAAEVKDEATKEAFVRLIKRRIAQLLPSGRSGPRRKGSGKSARPPLKFLDKLGRRRLNDTDFDEIIRVARGIYENPTLGAAARPGFADRLSAVIDELIREHPAISASTDWSVFTHWMYQHEGRALPRKEYNDLLSKFVARICEDAGLGHPDLQARLAANTEKMATLAADRERLARMGLASLDPTPQLFVNVRAPGRSGATEARLPYVDFILIFKGTTAAEKPRWVTAVKGQIKQHMVEGLVRHVDRWGTLRLGQLVNDELRGGRGAWRFDEVRIAREDIIDDPGLRETITMGFRDFTEAERAQLAKDNIAPTHIVHDIPSGDFWDYARRAFKSLGITVAAN
jgi:hypothetical protein